jgi:hypothetical protein
MAIPGVIFFSRAPVDGRGADAYRFLPENEQRRGPSGPALDTSVNWRCVHDWRSRTMKTSDVDLMLAVERTRRRNRFGTRKRLERERWDERDLWSAYVPGEPAGGRAANEPPPEVA